MSYLIKRVCIDNKIVNTNNAWIENDQESPEDYQEKINQTLTKNWISSKTPIIELDGEDTEWMMQALNCYALLTTTNTSQFEAASTVNKLYKPQLDKTISKYPFPTGNYFPRVERVSLKTGVHGSGPYNNLKTIIQSIITSSLGHECISLSDDLQKFKIYLLEWENIKHEFRVFIFQNEITAISTQHIYEIDSWLVEQTDEELYINVIQKIRYYFLSHLREKFLSLKNYTMDIAFLEDGTVYFIEPNCFGANYPAGSALFNWVEDHKTLHDPSQIEFRFKN